MTTRDDLPAFGRRSLLTGSAGAFLAGPPEISFWVAPQAPRA